MYCKLTAEFPRGTAWRHELIEEIPVGVLALIRVRSHEKIHMRTEVCVREDHREAIEQREARLEWLNKGGIVDWIWVTSIKLSEESFRPGAVVKLRGREELIRNSIFLAR
jgi:hypothetical protein